ncbi:MAG: VOC family protein [Hamadaea sp.]|nr:VOC family protein [Hamadaea sp.]NUR50461.1 VOC family protein [Hamadaea sp.]NUT07747.1 VOC family protein [Hamadaea sp.]
MKVTKPLVGRPCYVELSTSDTADAMRFYGGLFGWTAETDPRAEAGGYGMIKLGEAAIGGLSPLMQPDQPVAWTMSVGVTDADASTEAVRQAGGTVLAEPVDIFDSGRFSFVTDPTGAAFSLWQGRKFPGSERIDEDGALVWTELATRDTKAARDFYTTVFGWTATDGDMGGETYTQWGLGGEDFGGMMDMAGHHPPEVPPHWLLYFGVPDVDATVAKADPLGGTIIVPASDIPGTGRFACLQDPQGAVFAVYHSTASS